MKKSCLHWLYCTIIQPQRTLLRKELSLGWIRFWKIYYEFLEPEQTVHVECNRGKFNRLKTHWNRKNIFFKKIERWSCCMTIACLPFANTMQETCKEWVLEVLSSEYITELSLLDYNWFTTKQLTVGILSLLMYLSSTINNMGGVSFVTVICKEIWVEDPSSNLCLVFYVAFCKYALGKGMDPSRLPTTIDELVE